jgi:uracil phosphoribosyltransferase
VASPEGIKAFEEEHPDVDVVTCAIDEGLGKA